MSFRRPCDRCDVKFFPSSPHNRLCNYCVAQAHKTKRGKHLKKLSELIPYYVNKPDKYVCKYCGEKFRLEATHRIHEKKEHHGTIRC